MILHHETEEAMNTNTDEETLERLRIALVGPSFVSRKYGAGIRQQIRYLEGKKVTASPGV